MQVGSARTNSIGEIHFISVFCTFADVENISMDAKVCTVIKHSQRGKNLLENSLGGFTVEMKQINGILQITVSLQVNPRSCKLAGALHIIPLS